MVDDGFQLLVHPGRVVDVGKELIQFFLSLDAPDGQHAVVLCLKSIGCRAVGDEAAGEAFHGNEAHLMLLAGVDELQLLLAGDIAERELQRLVQAALNGLARH